jgi:multicomponent Na+:H+ antiporter subunit D
MIALSANVVIPLVGLALLALIRPTGSAVRVVAIASAIGTAIAAGFTVVAVIHEGVVSEVLGGWPAPLGIALIADGLSAVMLGMTALVGLAVTAFAIGEKREDAFWPLWLAVWAALNALYISGDAFNVYVALEVLGLAAVGLVALAGGPAIRAALRYLFVAVLGSLAYLLAVALLYADRGSLELALIAQTPGARVTSAVALALITIGMVLKTALLPVHGWLPPAHAGAPAPVSPVLSALVIKGSFYVLVRMWFTVLPDSSTLRAATLLGLLGAVAALWGGFMALRQDRLKLVVAYSTVAQVGYLFLIFPLVTPGLTSGLADGVDDGVRAGWTGAWTLALAHAVAKAAMFLSAGALAAGHGTDRLDQMGAAGARQPLSIAAFALAGVSLAGLPPSLGFTAKFLLLKSSVLSGQWWWAVPLVGGGLLAAAYVARVLRITISGAGADATEPHAQGANTSVLGGVAVARRRELPAVLLAGLAIVLGVAGGASVVTMLEDAAPMSISEGSR